MATLYDVTGDLLVLQDMMGDPDVNEQTLHDTLDAVNLEFSDKANGYAMVDRNLAATEEALKKEIDRLTAKKQAITNNRKRLKGALEEAMKVTGKTKFKTELFSFSIQNNPPSVKVLDESKVPEDFLIRHEPTVDKKALLNHIKAHGDTEYAELTQGESLRIR